MAKTVGIVRRVSDQPMREVNLIKEDRRYCDVGDVACGYFNGHGSAQGVGDHVYLGGIAAASAADRLRFSPPFPPWLERWALPEVLSIETDAGRCPWSARACNIRCQIPRCIQRLNRLSIVIAGSYPGGAIALTTTCLQDMDDPAQHTAVINPTCPKLVVRQVWLKNRKGFVAQPEQRTHNYISNVTSKPR